MVLARIEQFGRAAVGVQDQSADDSVAAPSRMFSTNIRYGRSAVDRVKTAARGAVGHDERVDLAGGDGSEGVLGLGHAQHRFAVGLADRSWLVFEIGERARVSREHRGRPDWALGRRSWRARGECRRGPATSESRPARDRP